MKEKERLVKPAVELKEEYLDFYLEWKTSGEDMTPRVIKKDPTHFDEMIQSLHDAEKGENLPAGWVPVSTYWLLIDNNRIAGVVNIRHSLTENLLNIGGHIGYGIRPSERRKGYATKLLSLTLEKTKELGIKKSLVVCDKWNEGSKRTIINNGGIPDRDFIEEDGNVILRFWIDTEGNDDNK
ncbi:GNAT family N-acetyltransferase [Bacillus haikouensis]|jgi:predicted acetyltransferase|uniref:GNAT family N-acetyltransferase n=1 Tax=Bacillus haikouensis TaxID=1510468 RepID=UPI0015521165|nr:GNAT family N-acetyltransferase [Bacillus haikouensis]NQD65942.1 GNAT family N-acetyltransferase [Bacillus haikouensis]